MIELLYYNVQHTILFIHQPPGGTVTKGNCFLFILTRCVSGALMMRFNLKVAVWLMTMCVIYICVSFWTKCDNVKNQDNNFHR